MLTITDMSFRIEGRSLFEDASLVLPAGSKAGLVGRNGTGKTTLFKLIQGELTPETGEITVHKRAKVGSVAQEAPSTEDSVLDMVLHADAERRDLMSRADTETDPHAIGEIHTRLAEIDAHTAEARASAILKGLGFDKAAQAGPCSALSGGWRMRVALAAMLFAEPDLLLLDEPTNYLDLEGALWLERYLATYPHTVLLISHDRDLLNKAVSSIVHLDKGRLTFYRGNYDRFDAQRRLQMEIVNKTREKQLAEIAHMQSYVDRFRYKANKAKQAQSRLKRIEKIKPVEALFDEDALPFSFTPPKRTVAAPILSFDDVSVGYDGKPVLSKIDGRIDPEDRIALIGVNGNGKSTFAKLLAGELAPMGGVMQKARKLEIAYFAQHQMDMLKPGETPLQHIEPLTHYDSEAKRRSRIAQMGLPTSRMDTVASKLSGGEKARLLMGLVTFSGPNLLILDEPTNHLDIDSRDALIQALNAFEGAVLIISHDRHLIEATVDQLWIAAEGTITVFDDDLEGYQRMLTNPGGIAEGGTPGIGGNGGGTGTGRGSGNGSGDASGDGVPRDRKAERQRAAALREETAPLRKAIKAAEADMAKHQSALDKIDAKLADPKLYEGDPAETVKLTTEQARLKSALEDAEAQWLEASEALEAAEKAQGV
ncbi:ABC-F family ATP-binding cassette domain-containing protein [Cucumibacter marinus]|uniref:ABC-F family ATP-binding cassette domain-containing protein n=1 Tax=Cucumibacter marinus TaxID=1121252 RepID=UPI0004219AEB|nr:ABC-F family ATP-binding cassette domain-containing protein [Cucumibacter marinus]